MKPYNWRQDYDWTDPDDYPVQDDKMFDIQSEEELMLPHEIKAPPKGIKSLGKENTKVADYKYRIQMFAEQLADDDGKDWDSLSDSQQDGYYKIAFDAWGSGDMYAEGGRIGYALGPDDPGIVEDDMTTLEFMQDQGVPYGEQASGIDPNIRIEAVVEEFIKRKGRKPRSIEEIKEFYFQEMAGGQGSPQRVAYNPGDYDPMIVEEYEKYKFGQEEQGGPVITIDEFLMQQRSGAQAGGLPGILGV